MSCAVVNGFKVFPFKFSETTQHPHQLFVKEHTARLSETEYPRKRTIFILNVPPYITEDGFERFFKWFGKVTSVSFKQSAQSSQEQTEPITGFKVAYVVFEAAESVRKVLNSDHLPPFSTEISPVLMGLKKTIAEHSITLDEDLLFKEANEYMEKYDQAEEEEKKKAKEQEVADDEGWITVTRHGKKAGLPRKESVENKIKLKEEKNRKRKELQNFYTFQIRESKVKHLANLRRKFEEDKQKIEALKRARKFKPY